MLAFWEFRVSTFTHFAKKWHGFQFALVACSLSRTMHNACRNGRLVCVDAQPASTRCAGSLATLGVPPDAHVLGVRLPRPLSRLLYVGAPATE